MEHSKYILRKDVLLKRCKILAVWDKFYPKAFGSSYWTITIKYAGIQWRDTGLSTHHNVNFNYYQDDGEKSKYEVDLETFRKIVDDNLKKYNIE